jgi:hypothetical protein
MDSSKAPERSPFEAGLTPQQTLDIASDLDDLTKTAGWGTLKELIRAARIKAREMAMDGPEEDIKTWKGYIKALETVEALPTYLLELASQVDQEEAKAERVSTYRGSLFLNGGGEDTF